MILLLLTACRTEDSADSAAPATYKALVADSGHGRGALLDLDDGSADAEFCLKELLPDDCGDSARADGIQCLVFGLTHELVDGKDALTLDYGRQGGDLRGIPGGILHATLDGDTTTLDWGIESLRYPDNPDLDALCASNPDVDERCVPGMPHESAWMPDGQTMVFTDTWNGRVLFVQQGEGTVGEVVGSIDPTTPGNPGQSYPNAVQVLEQDGRTLLLTTYKGVDPDSGLGVNEGRILLWDVTDLAAPSLVWAYPETGYLAAVHSGVYDATAGVLLYAHANGASASAAEGDDGSVGVASLHLPDPPEYVTDLVLAGDDPFGFVRHVVLEPDGATIFVTDSGCENEKDGECARTMRIVNLPLPALTPSGLSGGHSADHAQQVLTETDATGSVLTGNLDFPFSATWLPVDELGSALAGQRKCPAPG